MNALLNEVEKFIEITAYNTTEERLNALSYLKRRLLMMKSEDKDNHEIELAIIITELESLGLDKRMHDTEEPW